MALVEGFAELDKAWLEKVLKESEELPKEARLTKAEAQRVGAGEGFLSKVARVSLSWEGVGSSAAPSSVILKVPVASGMESLSDQMGAPQEAFKTDAETGESAFEFVYQVHETECRFYDYCRSAGQPFKTPRSFFTQTHGDGRTGVLVLEDIGRTGAVPHMSYPLNRAQLAEVFGEVARFHAYSLTHPEIFGIQQQQEMKPEAMESFVGFVTGVCQTLKQQQPQLFGDLIDKTLPFISTENFLGAFTYFLTSGQRPVMVHGDLWNNNFFFDKTTDKDGKPHHGDNLVAIIDFQMCRTGLPGDDLAHTLLSSVEPELFTKDLKGLIDELYYQPLLAALPKDMPAPYTLDAVLEQMEALALPNALQGLATASSQMPSLLQDPSAQERLGRMIGRMRGMLEWALPRFRAIPPASEEQLQQFMAQMNLQA